MSTGSLKVVFGPMKSDKTSFIRNKIRKYVDVMKRKVTYINSSHDTRSNQSYSLNCRVIYTLDNPENVTSLKVDNLSDVVITEKFIFIDEAQFFPDLYDIVKKWVNEGHQIYVAGLKSTSECNKFGQVLDLIPICDKTYEFFAVCEICARNDIKTKAPFTFCTIEKNNEIMVGSSQYMCLCRYHYAQQTK